MSSNFLARSILLFVALVFVDVGSVVGQGSHLFILSGQSNMNGLNPKETLIPTLEKRFGADHVIVIKDSHGGQPIRRWDKGWASDKNNESKTKSGPIGDLYDQLMSKVDTATKGRDIRTVTFLWMQGERDARERNADVYRASFMRLLDQLRTDLKHPNINYVIGRLSDFGNQNPDYPDWNKMRRVLVELADQSKRAKWVNTDDLNDGKNRRGETIENDLHYSVEGYKRFGQRMANAAIQILERIDVPYDLVPPATEGYHRVRYPASDQPGKLRFPVQYTVWIPPHVKTLRGVIVHQHGCGPGSCRSGLTGAYDLHWQALAAKHDCALLAATYEQPLEADCGLWCDPRNGSDETFVRALSDLGDASEHPELSQVPWALWGHSGGGTWAGTMLVLHPDRIAAVWLRSGSPLLTPRADRPDAKIVTLPADRIDVPVMLNLGAKEGFIDTEGRFASVWPRMKEWFLELRRRGTPISVAVDPLTGHECGNQRYLAIAWFDACLSFRLVVAGKHSGGLMATMPTESAWLAPLMQEPSCATIASPAAAYRGPLATSIWLPNEAVAKAWMQFIQGESISDTTPPPAVTDVVMEQGRIKWTPQADLQSGIAYFVIYRDGERLAQVPANPTNPFGRPIAQGLQFSDTPLLPLVDFTFELTDNFTKDPAGSAAADGPHQYSVTAVNTVGLSSNATYVVAAGREPSGGVVAAGRERSGGMSNNLEKPEGSRPAANKTNPPGRK